MAKGRLRASLAGHQANTAYAAKQAKAAAAAKVKAAASKIALPERKALKKQRQLREQRERAGESGEATIPFARDDTVLLLGEANFSFAHALVVGRGHPAHLVCATAFDSEEETYEKYPDAAAHVAALRKAGSRVAFNVDAGALDRAHKVVGKGRRWSRVVFNFPHAGSGITDQDRNVRDNQVLLLRALASVWPLLTEGPSSFPMPVKKGKKKVVVQLRGKNNRPPRVRAPSPPSDDEGELPDIEGDDEDKATPVAASFTPPLRQGSFLVTLLNQEPYTRWELQRLATKPPPAQTDSRKPQPRYRLLRSFEFVPSAWPGYAHRRTIGWREGLSKANNEEIVGRVGKARTWEFACWDGPEEE
ncbi:25S rRNA (uridine-N(3))-methyltransferase [Vanrija pseudolonga]|uniref:25S rRNA (Uridine-N(3))-methyltransferase n=1 Tax=Vanrija pseudolonga TaxID=143232 RepID=A0AAF0XZD1_9TREE|nr:25S rRNA (uridine-N(3))-methyltransferase [Vanrija pseudolonga]